MQVIDKLLDVSRNVHNYIKNRILEFSSIKDTGYTEFNFAPYLEIPAYKVDIFSEACFCILTANFRADRSILMQRALGMELCKEGTYEQIHNILQKYGHRFAKQRTDRILALREKRDLIFNIVRMQDSIEARKILVKEVDGYGLKEASHFLRNIGFLDVAIIDRHIFRFLIDQGLLPNQKTITPKLYLQAEYVLQRIAKSLNISLGELDLYIFYHQTKQVLK